MATTAYLAFEPSEEDAARRVAAELERNGWSVTRSSSELRVQDRIPALVQAIGEAAVFIVLTSPAALDSAWIQREVVAALNNGRPILIVQTADLPPDSWIRATLDTSTAIDLREGTESEVLTRIVERARAASGRGRVIAMLNIKGGVGKTVLAANLFAAAHLADKRSISFIDLDPQHNLTQYFLSPGERNRIRDRNHTIYSIVNPRGDTSLPVGDFGGIAVPLNRIKRGKQPNFELVAGDERLFEYTLDTRADRDKAEAFTRFRALVSALRARSDAVIIDSNPCATFLTRLAITCADHIIAPVRPEKYSLTGLNMLEQVVREVRGRPLQAGEFSVLLNGVNDRTRSGETGDADALTRTEIANAPFFGGALLPDEVPYSAVLRSAPTERIAANPINVTAMMRVGGRPAKEALTRAAASILRRAGS
ncbi:AAA family ATPase [Terricaulis silvestris]|uniref:Sporulation initiation inhibitor protein soj n=1 Tax=Terricaulis silvestris TaxID=2686094 RepID=A0A6I6MNW0_9CAUL|nr:AAA family ATPase [Terricaulis silvestris]QGZ95058.1 Sporulation initiation inhibitor protein soj [Terricaulis silvestris]